MDSEGNQVSSEDASDKSVALVGFFPMTNEEIRVVYVSKIVNGTELAFSVADHRVVVMGEKGFPNVLAHELGHIIGLNDIYMRVKSDETELPGWDAQVRYDMFGDVQTDWGDEVGRAFYCVDDSHGMVVDQLLMSGFNCFSSIDIPSGDVQGYSEQPNLSQGGEMRKVGADGMER